ncbi:glycosyl hydrolase family 35 [Colletotrichum costaricense]|uniref:Beta-galactosidase n=1 Tax=Colletotrichum costaricense TaxID=1209916 RepID=A0AAI9YMX6_9PEZI|nr:glycosyl hydrolase family 35 [Colletotrichum costaricense]KAK1516895.1 glycosyl hydrolase family 35 [Colletotrichum costaricense]
MKLSSFLAVTSLFFLPPTDAFLSRSHIKSTNITQDLVRWDEHSLFIRGERIVILSGEFHPWRIPSPGLWLDVLQKIKAVGYNAVSFYVNWALLEGKPGEVRMDNVFDLQPFIDAAVEAGLYLIARPGPYINSELSGGGFPGWLQRNKGELRSMAPDYTNATENYISSVLRVISAAQITNGGPIILVQPENEYSLAVGTANPVESTKLLDPNYMVFMEDQFRRNGIEVPLIGNDAVPLGNWAPGSGKGELNIYAHDAYPFYKGCDHPTDWTDLTALSLTYTYQNHLQQSPSSPYAVLEYQGGAPDPWGGVGLDKCAAKINQDFTRVFVKELVSRSIKILNLYMTYGGTNWGNMGHSEGYTSYDHGASIRENRGIDREKYSEAKIEAHFLRASEAYLTAIPQNATSTEFVSTPDLQVVPIVGDKTRFYVVRHTDYTSLNRTSYKLNVPTSVGNISIPLLGGDLSLHGRDSKIHITDHDVGGTSLIYSSAEIFTWKTYGNKTLLILYGGDGEEHEFAVPSSLGLPHFEGSNATTRTYGSFRAVHWVVQERRQVVHFETFEIHLLWRNDAYRHWVLDLPDTNDGLIKPTLGKSSIIVKGPYLLRNATFADGVLHLTGDINATTTLEILGGVPSNSPLTFNGRPLSNAQWKNGRLQAELVFESPALNLPVFPELQWHSINSLPEISNSYDDSAWTEAALEKSNNPRNLTTPTSLYCSDYGFHGGSLIYRGHFTATANESFFNVTTAGGFAYSHSVWVNDTFLGSFAGDSHTANSTQVFDLAGLKLEGPSVFTVVIDHMGMSMNFWARSDWMKLPRGIVDFSLGGHQQSDVKWKLTGNFGAESYIDKTRGPLNEGAFYAERQGYHLPGAPTSDWASVTPFEGIKTAGVAFYKTEFPLDMPIGYDIPLSFVISNVTASTGASSLFRAQLFVNGYQFGKYVNYLGPQTRFSVPEGILNYNGNNTVALTLWALDGSGARLEGFELAADHIIQSGYRKPGQTPQPSWVERVGAY